MIDASATCQNGHHDLCDGNAGRCGCHCHVPPIDEPETAEPVGIAPTGRSADRVYGGPR